MSLHAPFLVKQYLSNDLESGSYSRIFWYYPLEKEKSTQGGIGLFFEVLSGDVSDEVYEQITKRFWENFVDHFYQEGFEPALKHSIKLFIQLLRNFNVEEGLDVNIVLLNVVAAKKDAYTLKLISFGDSDIFVVRQGQFADMGKMVPLNESLYDLKFLEVELDKGDVLLLGNKTLLRNAFEADMISMDSIEVLLRSLESFKENLFGSKKLFVVAASESLVSDEDNPKKKFDIGGLFALVKTRAQLLLAALRPQLKAKKTEEAVVDDSFIDESAEELEGLRAVKQDTSSDIPVILSTNEKESIEDPETFNTIVEQKESFIMPPPVEETVNEASELDGEVIRPTEQLPGKTVSVDDFVVTSEITTSDVVEKSTYQDIVTEAKKSEAPKVLPRTSVNYVEELKAMHSPWAKFTRNATMKGVAGIFGKLVEKLGLTPKSAKGKVFLSRPSALEPKKVQPGVILIVVIVVIALVLKLRADSQQKKAEQAVLTTFNTVVQDFKTFYNNNIVPIGTEDTERQLDLCSAEATKVYTAGATADGKLKIPANKESVKTSVDQIKVFESECLAKYDRIYGIVRVRDAEVVTDFKVSLGNDSNITSMSLKDGALIVADQGRKAVYQVNVESKAVTRLEDPLGLISTPIAVGTGEGTLFVCDKTNGVLYFTDNATPGKQGFNRMVGTEPGSVGECAFIEGFAQNAYFVSASGTTLFRVKSKGSGYDAPEAYIKNLLGARSISIDGSIYVVSSVDGVGSVVKYFGGKVDNFALPESVELGETTVSYTNPSNDRNIYVYDRTNNQILSIEKPSGNRHPGVGIVVKTYKLENTAKFTDIKGIGVDLNGNNQEVNMYILSGSTIWKIKV